MSSSPLPLGEGQGEGGQTTAAIFESLPANEQYVWGLRYANDLVLRDRATGGSGNLGESGSGLNERLYALQDANWNVVALVDTSGVIQERFTYTAYGAATGVECQFHGLHGFHGFQVEHAFRGNECGRDHRAVL